MECRNGTRRSFVSFTSATRVKFPAQSLLAARRSSTRTDSATDQLTVTLDKTRTATGDAATQSRLRTTARSTSSCDTSTTTRKRAPRTTSPMLKASFSQIVMDDGCFPRTNRSSSAGNHSQAARQISSIARDPSSAMKFLPTGRAGAHATPTVTAASEVEKEAA